MDQELIGNNDLRDEALQHLDSLWQTAHWFTDNERDAETLVINTYLEASKVWDNSIFMKACKTQMFRVLMKILFGKIKLNFRLQLPDNIENMFESFPSDKFFEFKAISGDIVTKAIRRLPIEIRLIMVLSIFEKFSYQEIAEIIGSHRKTVRNNIYHGYMLLRQEIVNSLVVGESKLTIA
ncbi:MAG TPA: hypothetical protein DEO84_05030 [candidate division Zixibacteria bacterium]|jgi:RNA polymerase sigma factor (sigma-70 family)|nr:hypothetical protein [candidate division Zixibacteria bacterium]